MFYAIYIVFIIIRSPNRLSILPGLQESWKQEAELLSGQVPSTLKAKLASYMRWRFDQWGVRSQKLYLFLTELPCFSIKGLQWWTVSPKPQRSRSKSSHYQLCHFVWVCSCLAQSMAGFLALVFALSHTHSHVQMNAHTNVTDCDSQCLKKKKKCSLTSFLPVISLTFSRVFVWRHKRERGTDWRSRVFNKSLWVMTSADTITYHLISQLLNKNVKLFSFHTLKSFRVSYISIEYYCILDYWPDKTSSWTLGSLW